MEPEITVRLSISIRKRRAIGILAAALCFVAAPSTALPQQSTKIPKVGVLHAGSAKEPAVWQREPFERGLRELGWTPGKDILIDYRFGEGSTTRLSEQAVDLVRSGVDVIVARANQAINA